MGVSGKANLLISTEKNGTYNSSIDLTQELGNEQDLFVPVSSMNQDSWYGGDTPKFYDSSSPNILGNGEPVATEAVRGFFQKRLYLKTNLDYYAAQDLRIRRSCSTVFAR